MKINYSIIIKNKSRGNKNWTGRIRENGKTLDINLNTDSQAVAQEWLQKARNALLVYNTVAAANNGVVPPEIAAKVIHATKQGQALSSTAYPTIDSVAKEWLRSLIVAGRRETSIDTYTRALRQVIAGHADDSADSLSDPRLVRDILASFAGKSANTRRNYSTTLRELVKYYGETYDQDVKKAVKACVRVSIDEGKVNAWTDLEMTRIINCVRNKDKEAEQQIQTYFSLLAASGMRNTEAFLIEVNDLHDGCLYLRAETTKGRKSRIVPLSEGMFTKLSRMCQGRAGNERIFTKVPSSQAGRHDALRRAIDYCNSICQPQNRIEQQGLHQFRRSAAVMMYKKLDIKTVAAILGHSPTVSLRYYQQAKGQEETLEQVRELLDDSQLRQPTLYEDIIDLL